MLAYKNNNNQSVLSELQCLKGKFVALEQENQHLLGNLQQITIEKQQQHGELTLRVQKLEVTIVLLQQGTRIQGILKEPKINLPMKIDGMQPQFRGVLKFSNSNASFSISNGCITSDVSRHIT